MFLEVSGVELTTRARVVRRISGDQAGAPQTIEALGRRAGPAADHRDHRLAQRLILRERSRHPAQVVAEWSVIAPTAGLQFEQRQAALGHLVQASLRQVRVSADESEIPSDLALRAQRRPIAEVEIGDLLR